MQAMHQFRFPSGRKAARGNVFHRLTDNWRNCFMTSENPGSPVQFRMHKPNPYGNKHAIGRSPDIIVWSLDPKNAECQPGQYNRLMLDREMVDVQDKNCT